MVSSWYYKVLKFTPDGIVFPKKLAPFYNQYKKKILSGNHFFWTKIKSHTNKKELEELCKKLNLTKEDCDNILNCKCFLPPAEIPELNHYIEFKKKYDIIVERLSEEFWRNCDKNLEENEKKDILDHVKIV